MWVIVALFATFFSAAMLVLLTVASPSTKEMKEARRRLNQIRLPHSEAGDDSLNIMRREKPFSPLPLLDEFLKKLQLAEKLKLLLDQADLSWSVGKVLAIAVAMSFA